MFSFCFFIYNIIYFFILNKYLMYVIEVWMIIFKQTTFSWHKIENEKLFRKAFHIFYIKEKREKNIDWRISRMEFIYHLLASDLIFPKVLENLKWFIFVLEKWFTLFFKINFNKSFKIPIHNSMKLVTRTFC